VEVSFHGRRTKGWVLGATDDVPAGMLPVRKLLSHVAFFDDPMLAVLRWVSQRYVAPLASVIARAVPPRVVSEEGEAIDRGGGGGAVAPLASPSPTPLRNAPAADRAHSVTGRDSSEAERGGLAPGAPRLAGYVGGTEVLDALGGGSGGYVLRPAPEDEAWLAVEAVTAALAARRRAVVLVPEADPLPATVSAILEAFGERVALFLGGSKRARYRMWLDIQRGSFDVVVGSRPAVFAPLANLGLVFVARESHPGHREERSPYYHVRDVALARSEMGGAVCVLSALFPSSEASEKRIPVVAPADRRWPPVEVVRPGPEGRAPRVVAALREARRGFLYSPLPGYGVAQVCRSCGQPASCAACGGLLRAEGRRVGCVVCGAAGRCATCGASDFGIRRGGAERVEEWAARVARVPVSRADGGIQGFPPEGIVVGGPEAVTEMGLPGLDVVGILDADLAIRRPGLSAVERALATWAEAAGWARPKGRVIVQSDRPNDPAIQALVAGRPERFHRAEFRRRAAAGFPVGAPVFRVVGTGELPAILDSLAPVTLLVTEVGAETVCLLALEPGRLEEFGRLARDLATRDVIARVEAEPHL
jgi:primosomal protein N' (replication factor Y)